MKYCSLFMTGILMIVLLSCKKQPNNIFSKNNNIPASDTATPACILNMITSLQNEPVRNPSTVIYSYTYQDQKVYYVSADCCDQWNLLYDGNCNLLCAPDGGIANQGDGRCTDFLATRTNERLVWKDPR